MFDRDYDSFLSVILQTVVENVNNEYKSPYDLVNLDSRIGFLRMLVRN